jgi:MinD superfamily P-loop ATPase
MHRKIKIAVLSGKGGTGKTFVSTNLANVIPFSTYIDCDVEEPNGSIFFHENLPKTKPVFVLIPVVNPLLCIGCRNCVSFCQFNALAMINKKVKVFEEVCHSCGGCSLVCPEKAISEKKKIIGYITEYKDESTNIKSGKMNIGEESGVPIIKEMLSEADDSLVQIIDAPPGTSCSVVESITGVDYCIIVGEPSLYGLENLKMVVSLVTGMNIPFGIVINKEMEKDNILSDYAKASKLSVLASIPYTTSYAQIVSKGLLLTNESPEIKSTFEKLAKDLIEVIL